MYSGMELEKETYEQQLLNFTWKLLDGRLTSAKKLGKKEVYRETVNRIGKMFPRAILSFLSEKGWERKKYCTKTEVKTGRIWESPDFQELTLSFQEDSVKLILDLFRFYNKREPGDPLKDSAKGVWKKGSPSERLLAHLISVPISRSGKFLELEEQISSWNGWNQITFAMDPKYQGAFSPRSVKTVFEEWGWALPWLTPYLVKFWVKIYGGKFSSSITLYRATMDRMSTALESLFNEAHKEKRPDWMVPLMEFLRELSKDKEKPEEITKPLETLVAGESHKVRQQHRDEWANLLKLSILLSVEHQRIRRLHPIDRGGPQKLFLTSWVEKGMAEVVEWTETLRIHLENVVG